MEYETVIIYDEETGDTRRELISQTRDPVDIDRGRKVRTSKIRMTTVTRRTARHVRFPINLQSPRQDTRPRVPKTRGDTDEFISAFWINGKPKCRSGYTYDFST